MKTALLLLSLVPLAACNGVTDVSYGNADPAAAPSPPESVASDAPAPAAPGEPFNPNAPGSQTPAQPPRDTCDGTLAYPGMNGDELTASRLAYEPGTNRARMLPYKQLRAEYLRVLGVVPKFMGYQDFTFYEPVIRWFTEPELNAINVLISFRSGFQGCRAYLKEAMYEVPPTADTARAQCQAWQRRFWSVEPTEEEIAVCAAVVLHPSNTEPSIKNRWAYGCASVLTSTQFLTY